LEPRLYRDFKENAMRMQVWLQHQWAYGLIVTALFWLIAATSSSAQTSLPLDQIYFHSAVSHGGRGCPQEARVEATLGDDGRSVHIVFDSYQAQVSPDSSPVARTTCLVSLPLHIPSGWQYSVSTADTRRTLWLETGVRARHLTEIYFQGDTGFELVEHYQGPVQSNDSIDNTTQMSKAGPVWSSCHSQRNLNLRTVLYVTNRDNRDSRGHLTIHSPEVYTLAWRPCE
jgi:Domain of unknown function (DUF4360)